jgi:hypothetical protein
MELNWIFGLLVFSGPVARVTVQSPAETEIKGMPRVLSFVSRAFSPPIPGVYQRSFCSPCSSRIIYYVMLDQNAFEQKLLSQLCPPA